MCEKKPIIHNKRRLKRGNEENLSRLRFLTIEVIWVEKVPDNSFDY